MTQHPLTDISAYADGELAAQDMARIECHLAECTECARELALIKSMGAVMAQETRRRAGRESVWPGVHRRLTQPIGWILVVAGVAVWGALAVVEWFRAGALTPEWLATTAIGIGLALIVVAIGHQQYREWRESPYKDVDK
jgi:anti-sigma factor RsiW